MKKIPDVNDILVIDTTGDWPTKSGGNLHVLYRLDYKVLQDFLSYDMDELAKIKTDIRGLRSYVVTDIKKGCVGANEWHRVRNELVYCTRGTLRWTCKDLFGNTREFLLEKDKAILTPHHILHTYTSLSPISSISVLANTLFIPDNPSTHDTYSSIEFQSNLI